MIVEAEQNIFWSHFSANYIGCGTCPLFFKHLLPNIKYVMIHSSKEMSHTPECKVQLTWQPWRLDNPKRITSDGEVTSENSPPSLTYPTTTSTNNSYIQQLTQLINSTREFLTSSLSSSSSSSLSVDPEAFGWPSDAREKEQSEPTDLSLPNRKQVQDSNFQTSLPSSFISLSPTPDLMLKQLKSDSATGSLMFPNDYLTWLNYFTASLGPQIAQSQQPSAASTPLLDRKPSSFCGSSLTSPSVTLTPGSSGYQTPPRSNLTHSRLFASSSSPEGFLPASAEDKGVLDGSSFVCNICGKIYTQASALKMHIRTHTLPCRCEYCGKSFSRKWLLKGHERTHTGERPYRCTTCNRSFADRSNLRAHLQTHQVYKRYKCSSCPRSFSRIGLLQKHLSQSLKCANLPHHVHTDSLERT